MRRRRATVSTVGCAAWNRFPRRGSRPPVRPPFLGAVVGVSDRTRHEGGNDMRTTLLEAAFAHHVWATIMLIDFCTDLSPRQLQHVVPGTRGPIIETLAHLVDADMWDLAILEGRDLADV